MAKDNYLFAVGAIREAEKRLMNCDDMKRMINAESAEKSFKVFNDLSYSDELLEISRPDKFPDVLIHDLGQVKDFISGIVTDESLLKLLFAEEDFLNLKILFKSLLKEEKTSEGLSDLSYIDSGIMKKRILEGDKSRSLGEDYEKIVNEAVSATSRLHSSSETSSYFDKKKFAFMDELARRIKSNRLSEIISCQADNANIKAVFRSHILGLSLAEARNFLIESGDLNPDLLGSYVELDEGDIIDKIINLVPDQDFVSDLENLKSEFSIWKLEKILDDRLRRMILKTRVDPAGPASVCAYYLDKKNEIKNIGIIMAGKLNNAKVEEINARARVLR